MNDREKLIEIIGLTEYGNGALVGKNFQRGFIGKIADHMIENGVTVQKWIPVSDMLPRFMQIVLVTDGKYVYKAALNTKNKWIGDYINSMTFKATHWMQLPKPPKGE